MMERRLGAGGTVVVFRQWRKAERQRMVSIQSEA